MTYAPTHATRIASAHAAGLDTPIAVARGDGIGPEIMDAVFAILEAAGARLDVAEVEAGEAVYRRGVTSGIEPGCWQTLRERRVLLKAPMTTPQGSGYKSLNVTLRKTLGLYANVRPCVAYAPYVPTRHPKMDLVVIRENEEDLYAGIEHRQTDEVYQCLKLITRPGCERIVRYAFEFARANQRHKVTCFTKSNIMKMTDGLFRQVFLDMAREYADIEAEHLIVDAGAARLATRPESFDVLVMPNLYGDILSDVAAEMSGALGLAGTANIGDHGALFEAIHGSAPDIAGQNKANPSGLLLAGVMMLHHIGQHEAADHVHHAWLATLEDGVHTADIARTSHTTKVVGTRQFAQEVVARLGAAPETLKAGTLSLPDLAPAPAVPAPARRATKDIVGVDVFMHWTAGDADALAEAIRAVDLNGFDLMMITNRGVKVWPNGLPETFCVDHWRCRFMVSNGADETSHAQVLGLLGNLAQGGLDFVKTEHLCTFDDEPGFSLGQGQ